MPNLLQQLRDSFRRKPREQADDTDEPRTRSRVFAITCVLIAVVIGLIVIWFLPQWKIDHSLDAKLSLDRAKQLELQDAFRKTISQIVLSLSGLLILYFTWRRAEASDKTVRIMEQGHITDRFTKAIEQLGKTDGDKPNIEVRLGAIYALERIAIDSERDHWTIMEVLTAYVRQNAPLDPGRPYIEGEKPRTDIQAILTVLGRRRTGPKRERPGQWIDLSMSRLCGANLRYANLQKAVFQHANLQEGQFPFADLQDACLSQASLRDSYMGDAKLRNATLMDADMQKAFLKDTDLHNANLENANLGSAVLMHTSLQEANLTDIDFRNTLLWDVDLQGASGLTANQIKLAVEWERAHYSPAFRAELGLPAEPTEH